MGKFGYILVDFDNFFPRDFSQESVKHALKKVIGSIEGVEGLDFIQVRLYGGWYQDYAMTNRASSIVSMIPHLSFFPLIFGGKMIGGDIELATTLVNDDFVWGETYEEKDGIPKIIIKSSLGEACGQHGSNCPLRVLQNLTKKVSKKCEMDNCEIIHRDAIKRMGQKCVDSILVCDIITLSQDNNCNTIVVLSDDRDVHPAFVASVHARREKRVDYYMTNPQRFDSYNTILSRFNIHCHLYEYDVL